MGTRKKARERCSFFSHPHPPSPTSRRVPNSLFSDRCCRCFAAASSSLSLAARPPSLPSSPSQLPASCRLANAQPRWPQPAPEATTRDRPRPRRRPRPLLLRMLRRKLRPRRTRSPRSRTAPRASPLAGSSTATTLSPSEHERQRVGEKGRKAPPFSRARKELARESRRFRNRAINEFALLAHSNPQRFKFPPSTTTGPTAPPRPRPRSPPLTS